MQKIGRIPVRLRDPIRRIAVFEIKLPDKRSLTMTGNSFAEPIRKTILIHAVPSVVWRALTDTAWMTQWMSGTGLVITTSWKPGSSFTIDGGEHEVGFRNTGQVLRFEPERAVAYSHLSSLSRLPDLVENHTVIEFWLTPEGDNTQVELTVSNFPTESIYRHIVFYWNVALVLLKQFAEQEAG